MPFNVSETVAVGLVATAAVAAFAVELAAPTLTDNAVTVDAGQGPFSSSGSYRKVVTGHWAEPDAKHREWIGDTGRKGHPFVNRRGHRPAMEGTPC